MTHELKNNILTIALVARMDSKNAEEVGAELEQITAGCRFSELILDAEPLAYISSAGLRVILKLRRKYPSLRVVNASSEVYEIFEMTGFTEMINIEKAFRKFSVEGCQIIGKGAKGTVYRYNEDTIIKVYKSPDSLPEIKNERELARRAFVLGIPTAISFDIVKVGDQYGSVFELLNAKTFSQLIAEHPENLTEYIREYALLLKKIHATKVDAADMPDFKDTVRRWLVTAAPHFEPAAAEKLSRLVEELPDRLTMLHCDYHTNNVLSQNGETLLIDMDTLSHGHPIFELATVYLTFVGFNDALPANSQDFLGYSAETAKKCWEAFLPIYLGTDDPARIADVERKVICMSSARLIRFATRHFSDPAAQTRAIAVAKQNLESNIEAVDTLDF